MKARIAKAINNHGDGLGLIIVVILLLLITAGMLSNSLIPVSSKATDTLKTQANRLQDVNNAVAK